MQAYTHLAAGAAIQVAIAGARRLTLAERFAVGIAAVASHPLLDALARLTYHPHSPLWSDPLWVAYHLLAAALFFVFAFQLRAVAFGAFLALLPDLDWVLRALGVQSPWGEGALHRAFGSLPGVSSWVLITSRWPDFTQVLLACVPELLLAFGLLAVVRRATLHRPMDFKLSPNFRGRKR